MSLSSIYLLLRERHSRKEYIKEFQDVLKWRSWEYQMIFFYYNHFEITGGPCNLIGSNRCDLFTNRTIFCRKSYLFPSQWGGYTKKTKQPIRFQGLFKVTNQIVGKWKTEYHEANFATFVSKKKKWMNLFSNQLYTTSIKYLNWPNSVLGRFQNGCNKVVIEPRVV